MKKQNGTLSVHSENIFPIIRQWLYTERDIFLRELVSNAMDAIVKRNRLMELGETPAQDGTFAVTVRLDSQNKTITVSDDGVGMTEEEIHRYINQIAYSGLLDFVSKYKESDERGERIIGHFGLGFYSSFMVSDKVEIETLSCLPEAEPVHWSSKDGIEFEMEAGHRTEPGTEVILHLTETDAATYTEEKLQVQLKRFCGFMSSPLFLQVDDQKPKQINNTKPLWKENPKEITPEAYKQFYKDTFEESEDPLFWIHLNWDYPFRLQGILYFPNKMPYGHTLEGRIKVYSHQIFVSDAMREMIPEFLFFLQGCLECPDLPLNVSRSALQSDETVQKLSKHIVKKVADELNTLHKERPEYYHQAWPSISPVIKWGYLSDERFAQRLKDSLLIENWDHTFQKVCELPDGEIFYAGRGNKLDPYVSLAQNSGKPVFVMEEGIDLQWFSFLEQLFDQRFHFKEVDSSVGGELQKDFVTTVMTRQIQSYWPAVGTVEGRLLPDESLPALLEEEEWTRRLKEYESWASQWSGKKDTQSQEENGSIKLVLNTKNSLVKAFKEELVSDPESSKSACLGRLIVNLAQLSRQELKGEYYTQFMKDVQESIIK